MDFIKIIQELPPWKNSEKTYKVLVSDPEEFLGYMIEVRPANPRHLVDTISKFQPLLTWTSCRCFARLLMAFQFDSKYFMIFEDFEEVSRVFSLEEMQRLLIEAETGLKHIHNKNSFHGDLSEDCVKITKDCIKIVGWKLPKMRSFDPEPEIDLFEEDFQNLRKVFAKISGFSIEELLSCRFKSLKEPSRPCEDRFNYEVLSQNPVFFINGRVLRYFCSDSEGVVGTTTVPKGSVLTFFNGKLFRSGGDLSDQLFLEYCFESNCWKDCGKLLSPHKYHTGVGFNGELWILAGIRSNKVEKFDGEKWLVGPELPECLENPTSSVSDTLYLYSKGIFKLTESNWTKLGILEWVGFQGFHLNENNFLIIGGRTATTYNEDVIVFDTNTENSEKYADGITGLYGLFSFSLLQSKLTLVNNAGKVRSFDFPSMKIIENS